jgi:RNA polymerase sigma-70 factor, ECF subfamily
MISMEVDTTLLDGARAMDREALAKIFDLYAPALYRYALRFCNNERKADYIVGDVFSKLLEHLSAGHGPKSNIRSYLFEMAYHLVVDEIRYSRRNLPVELIELSFPEGNSIYATTENRILFESVQRAIQNDLTGDQRQVIILRFLDGCSLKETALILSKTVENVKVIQYRALAVLRKAMDNQEAETDFIPEMNMDQMEGMASNTIGA